MHHPDINNPRQRGFTLVEMIVTVTVASILMAIAVPSFSRFVTSSRLSEQTNELIAAIHFARSEAIKRNAGITLCRAANAAATDCAGSTGAWTDWIVRTPNGNVIRRGTVQTHNGSLVVGSTLTSDTLVFGSDGLARTGGVLVNAGLDDTGHGLRICSSSQSDDNIRAVVLGAGSRVTTTKGSGEC